MSFVRNSILALVAVALAFSVGANLSPSKALGADFLLDPTIVTGIEEEWFAWVHATCRYQIDHFWCDQGVGGYSLSFGKD